MTTRNTGCWHCGEPLPPADVIHARVGGVLRPMCCHGCRAAAEWIEQLGLDDYYRLRTQPAQRPVSDDCGRDAWQRAEAARHVVRDLGVGRQEMMLLIEGVRCAACVWLIERALGALPGVINVQVNAAARRARVVWQDAQTSLPQILETLSRAGYRALPLDAQALDDVRRRESRGALKRLLVAGFGTMQAMMYAAVLYLGAIDPLDATTRELFRWLGFLVATPVVFYCARPFFDGALRSLKARRPGMDVPVALAIGAIYAASLVEALRGGEHVYFDSVSMFVFFLLAGRYLEMRARHRAGDLTDALARLTPSFAERCRDDGTLERIGIHELRVGDCVHVSEGGLVPADGVLLSERCRVDEALLSGESAPLAKQQGEMLVAGSVLVDGPARLRVERVGADTALAAIAALVGRAQSERPRLARAGERAASRFVVRVLALTALTATIWSFVDPGRAFTAALAVLVVSCPCAFALAVPAAITRALAVLASRGVLVVRPDAVQALAEATHVVFDKTGTLTELELALADVASLRGSVSYRPSLDTFGEESLAEVASTSLAPLSFGEVDLFGCGFTALGQGSGDSAAAREAALRLAAALARESSHPAARAIAAAHNGDVEEASDVSVQPGLGITATVGGRTLRLGRADFALAGKTVADCDDAVLLADDDGAIAAFRLGERPRPGAAAAIEALRAQGLQIFISSGDAASRVRAIAAQVGVSHWRARQLPADKLAWLTELRAGGAHIVAIGDGINDAPVLAGADVAIALAGGAELAQVSSDMVLADNRLDALAPARALARQTLAVLQQNQRWALCYNMAAVPLAALGFVPPWLAALGMSASSLVVILNALRIGRERAVMQVAAPTSAAQRAGAV